MKLLFSFVILFLSFYCFNIQAHQHTTREFIIDTDVGLDDAIAILYLLQRPDIHVKAITVESDGNAHCIPAMENIEGLLRLVHHEEIPVACGRETPLRGNHIFPKDIMEICDTLAGTLLTKPKITSTQHKAKNLLIKTLNNSTNPIDILAIGPLTTIAEVLKQQPELKNKIHMIYAMGGAVNVPGNIRDVDPSNDNRVAEWNIYIDPYAAEQVFHSGIPITLVPLDVTHKVLIDHGFYNRIKRQANTPAARFVYDLLTHNKQMLLDKVWYFWDPMAAVIATNPEIATIKTLPLSVRLNPPDVSGATVIDKKQGAPIHVCVNIKSRKFKNILLAGLN